MQVPFKRHAQKVSSESSTQKVLTSYNIRTNRYHLLYLVIFKQHEWSRTTLSGPNIIKIYELLGIRLFVSVVIFF